MSIYIGTGQLNLLAGKRPLTNVVVPGRPPPAEKGRGRVIIGLIDRLPTADQVAESFCYEINVPGPIPQCAESVSFPGDRCMASAFPVVPV